MYFALTSELKWWSLLSELGECSYTSQSSEPGKKSDKFFCTRPPTTIPCPGLIVILVH